MYFPRKDGESNGRLNLDHFIELCNDWVHGGVLKSDDREDLVGAFSEELAIWFQDTSTFGN